MVVVEPPLDRLVRVVRAGAAAQPVERDLVGNLEREGHAEVPPDVREHRVERLRLHGRPGKPVEDEARFGVGLLEPVADQLDHQVVGDQVAAFDRLLHALTELRARVHLRAQDLAAGDVRNAVLRRDPLRLRAFAGPLRAEEQNVQRHYLRKPS